jgi:cellulose synthase/poly-beta-1,6-N-acetylglucosamine synthase-like glycosyltransferase
MGALFVVSLLLLAYTYAGYPLVCAALARLRPRPVRDDPWWRPTVSVVIAARDEGSVLRRKIQSVLEQRWPPRALEIIVVDDGSDDATAAVAASFPGVRLVPLPRPAGKAVALNHGVARARGEVLVLTDARQPLEPDAIAWLVAPLADPTVGAVSGELSLAPGGGGLGLHRRIDDAVRRLEAASGSSVGVTGALWAMRRRLWAQLPPRLILDDLYQPLSVARRGGRVVVAPQARVRDTASPDPRRELRRRARTLAGNLQLLSVAPWALAPGRNPLFFRLVSHKLLRLVAPAALVGLALSSLSLALSPDGGVLPSLALSGQVLLYGFAAFEWPIETEHGSTATRWLLRLARLCRSFVMLHVAAVSGIWAYLRGAEGRLWRDPPSHQGEGRASA